MNRDEGRGTTASPASSSSYLIYLFIISAIVVAILPSLIGHLFMQSGSNNKETIPRSNRASPTYNYISTDSKMQQVYYTERRQDALESLVVDLQEVLQMEREKTWQLEHEIRVLQMSERFLKDRVHMLEVRGVGVRRDSPVGRTPVELLTQSVSEQGKHEELHSLFRELSRIVHVEKARTSALESEIDNLKKTQSMLIFTVKALEEKLASFVASQRQTSVYAGPNEERTSMRN